MRQIAGSVCVFCREPIADFQQGVFCEGCGNPRHAGCTSPEAAAGDRRCCSVCGVNLERAKLGKRQVPPKPGPIATGLVIRRFVAAVLFVLAAALLIVALLHVGEAQHISSLIGTFMPSLLCTIVGLLIWGK